MTPAARGRGHRRPAGLVHAPRCAAPRESSRSSRWDKGLVAAHPGVGVFRAMVPRHAAPVGPLPDLLAIGRSLRKPPLLRLAMSAWPRARPATRWLREMNQVGNGAYFQSCCVSRTRSGRAIWPCVAIVLHGFRRSPRRVSASQRVSRQPAVRMPRAHKARRQFAAIGMICSGLYVWSAGLRAGAPTATCTVRARSVPRSRCDPSLCRFDRDGKRRAGEERFSCAISGSCSWPRAFLGSGVSRFRPRAKPGHEVDRPRGVTKSAANTRSPSFSRSSSSTRITILPALIVGDDFRGAD